MATARGTAVKDTAARRKGARERIPPHPDVRTIALQQVLEALVDPVRRHIVSQLYAPRQELSCGTFDLPVSKSTATHHFHVLREAGLIRQYYAGTSRMNALRHDEIEEAFPGLLPALLNEGEGEGKGQGEGEGERVGERVGAGDGERDGE